MATDARIAELLERYPDGLTDDELAELRAAAAADPAIEDRMDAVVEAMARLQGVPDEPRLSDVGRKRLMDRIGEEAKGWSTGGATPSGKADADAPRAWSTGGATPSGHADAEKFVSFDEVRRRRGLLGGNRAAQALAAGLAVAAGFMVKDVLDGFTPDPPGYTYKGDDDTADPDRIEGELLIYGTGDEGRLDDGAARPADRPVTFYGAPDKDCALVLLETQAGATYVVFPEPGQAWLAHAGPDNLLEPEGASSEYFPGAAGEATYTLLASPPHAPIPVPPDRKVASPESLIEGQEATYVLDSVRIGWEETAE